MNKIIILLLYVFILILKVNCDSTNKENSKNKKFIPYFRRQVEEIEDKNLPETADKDDPSSNFVSFIVDNVKEIFDDVVEKPEVKTRQTNATTTTTEITSTSLQPIVTFKAATELFRRTINGSEATTLSRSTTLIYPTRTDVILYENLTLRTLIEDIQKFTGLYGLNTKGPPKTMSPSKDETYNYQRPDKREREINMIARAFPLLAVNSSEPETEQDPRRSCVMCNNVATEDCNDPKNKLIQSVMCDREDDLCYSMHTPFGIIDRGCFNSNHNLTTYVCSCNLCNYISISEMPYMFSKKREWVENVIDISRTRHFRKSVYKDMSCLKCEVNTTHQQGDILDSANCLEGHIGSVPVAQCTADEVCGVKAVRADGYIWRGCIKTPLYNYWWTLCDYDLCNFDKIISLYDFV